MKKTIAGTLLAAMVVFTVVACGKDDDTAHQCSCAADDLFVIAEDLPSQTATSTGQLRYEHCSEAPDLGQLYALTFNNTVRGVIQVTTVHPQTLGYTAVMDLLDTDGCAGARRSIISAVCGNCSAGQFQISYAYPIDTTGRFMAIASTAPDCGVFVVGTTYRLFVDTQNTWIDVALVSAISTSGHTQLTFDARTELPFLSFQACYTLTAP